MSVNTVQNVFSKEVLDKLCLVTRQGKQPTTTNFFNYDGRITGFSNAVFGFDLSEELIEEVIDELLAKNILPKKPKKLNIYVHMFSRNSFIPWHDDGIYKFTGTVYLNPEWHIDLGGLFVYEEDGSLKCLTPVQNNGVFFVPPLGHTTTCTALNAPFRESLQLFVEEFE